MNTNKLIFSQVMDHLPLHTFRRCVSRYHGNRYVKKFRCYEQYLVMAFSQLTHLESLRDVSACPSEQALLHEHQFLECLTYNFI